MGLFKRLFTRATKSPKVLSAADDQVLQVEYRPPIFTDCECCGGVTTTLNRLVTRDGSPYAMCRITFSEAHLDDPARGIFGIGLFGEGTSPDERVAFGVVLRPSGTMVVDATETDWPETDILGPKLTREAALQHKRKSELFRLIDELYAGDRFLNEHFTKVNAA